MSSREGYHPSGEFDENNEFGEKLILDSTSRLMFKDGGRHVCHLFVFVTSLLMLKEQGMNNYTFPSCISIKCTCVSINWLICWLWHFEELDEISPNSSHSPNLSKPSNPTAWRAGMSWNNLHKFGSLMKFRQIRQNLQLQILQHGGFAWVELICINLADG